MRIKPEELFIENLAGNIPVGSMQYMAKDRALELLKKSSGEDYGFDVERWRLWLESEQAKE